MDYQDKVEGSFIVVSRDETVSSSTISTLISAAHSQDATHISAVALGSDDSSTLRSSTDSSNPTSLNSKENTQLDVSVLQQQLQSLSKSNKTFENWARTFRCVPEQYYTPTTEEEVIKVTSDH